MIDKFLKAKHWQLFILMFGIPILLQMIFMGTIFSNIQSQTTPNPTEIFNVMKYFPIIMVLYLGVFFGWYWSVAIGLQRRVPENITMKTKKFKILFFIPLVYLIIIAFFIGGIFGEVLQNETEPNIGFLGSLVGIIIPLHIVSMFGIFYSIYFIAKTLKTIELQKEVRFSDFIGEFFLIWFSIVGIWILQPRINKMHEDHDTSEYI